MSSARRSLDFPRFVLPTLLALTASLLMAPTAAWATSDKDCQRPIAPEVPEAENATEVAMISTRVRINMYVEAANLYIECLDEASASIGETGREVKERRIQKKRDSIQEEMVKVAENYNEQVGIYRERLAREQGVDLDSASEASSDAARSGSAPAADPPPVGDNAMPAPSVQQPTGKPAADPASK